MENKGQHSTIPIKSQPDNRHTRVFRGGQKMVESLNTTIELSPELTNPATEIGLNVQNICENALKLAIRRLQGLNVQKQMVDEPGFEPGTSTMPTWRSCQTDLLAQTIWLLRFNPRHLISVSYSGIFFII